MKRILAVVLTLALACGCSTNPVTGRDQMVGVPAAQAHADIGFALSAGSQRMATTDPCGDECLEQRQRFVAQVKRLGADLESAARTMSPELFQRIESFQVGVDPELGIATGSSASGRVALGEGLARLDPPDDVTAFLIAREMAHVIGRHDEEDSGARIVFSALTTLLPFALVARVVASTLGSGALMGSWAEEQRREADEIALSLLVRTGRSPTQVARALEGGVKKAQLPEGEWATRYAESAQRVAASAGVGGKYANSNDTFDNWLLQESLRSIERISSCARSALGGLTQETIDARRRECMGSAA